MSIFFSIIIPTYNRAHLIEQTIQTVLNQSYKNFELIVVDDGSTDDTEEVLTEIIKKNTATTILYYKKTNAERAAARNYGLQKSKGDYVLFFDSDDELYPNHLQVAFDSILELKSPEAFHLSYDIKNEQGQKIGKGPDFSSTANKALIKGNFLSCNGVFLKRDLAVHNPFNEMRALSGVEDWELWLRIATQHPIHCVNKITSTIVNHEDRSVLEVDKIKLVSKMELLIQTVMANPSLSNHYKKDLPFFQLSCYSYISLHLALNKVYRKDALRYLMKCLYMRPTYIFKKRFYATIKHLI